MGNSFLPFRRGKDGWNELAVLAIVEFDSNRKIIMCCRLMA